MTTKKYDIGDQVSVLDEAVDGIENELKELTAGVLKETLLKTTKTLFKPPDTLRSCCFPMTAIVFDINDESDDQTVD